jgi:hypothetical protein
MLFNPNLQSWQEGCLNLYFAVSVYAYASVALQYVPKPAPIMAPTRKELLAPPPTEAAAAAAAAGAKLTKAEERAVGQVDRAVYTAYFRSWSPAFWIPATVLTLAMVERGLQVRGWGTRLIGLLKWPELEGTQH